MATASSITNERRVRSVCVVTTKNSTGWPHKSFGHKLADVTTLSRAASLAWYRRNRMRSRQLFDLISAEAYYSQPISLRHPIVFYEGHLPGLQLQHAHETGAGRRRASTRGSKRLFARGIDPHESDGSAATAVPDNAAQWPSRDEVLAFADEADRQVIEALEHCRSRRRLDIRSLDRARRRIHHPRARSDAPGDAALHVAPSALRPEEEARPAISARTRRRRRRDRNGSRFPGGCATLGVNRSAIPFGWDNEFPALTVGVPGFAIDRHDVTNARFLEFVEDGGYRDERWWTAEDWQWVRTEAISHPLFWERDGDEWHWRGMFERVSLPLSWPVYVSLAEASAFARWSGARLPTEAEFQRAAYGSPEDDRRYPWGSTRNHPTAPASSTSRAGIRNPPAVTRRAPARGESKISSATAGNGLARRSRRFQAFARWRHTPNTPPTSSTVSISS